VCQPYQESGNPHAPLTPYLTSESLADLADADVALTRAGEKNNAKVQNVEALEAVATSMQTIADQKVRDKDSAATSAETAKSDAEAAARRRGARPARPLLRIPRHLRGPGQRHDPLHRHRHAAAPAARARPAEGPPRR